LRLIERANGIRLKAVERCANERLPGADECAVHLGQAVADFRAIIAAAQDKP
jgi:hypothetical protein